MSGQDQRGFVIVAVAACCSVMAMLAAVVVLVAATADAAARYRLERAQAARLARGILDQVCAALEAGRLGPPVDDGLVSIPADTVVTVETVAALPVPEGMGWPPPGAPSMRVEAPTYGGHATMVAVVGPDGAVRGAASGAPEGLLVDIAAAAWFRRGRAVATARVLVQDGTVRRID